jgi:predicted nucleotide-binding protein (sugar kinase/HSP70/actin superfamily)
MGFRRFDLHVSPVMSYMEVILEEAEEVSRTELEIVQARQTRVGKNAADTSRLRSAKRKIRMARLFRGIWRNLLAGPLYRASGLEMPAPISGMIEASRELLPTYRPIGELAPYIGEALVELRHGTDVVLNVAPNGCMISTMGEVLTPSIMHAQGVGSGRIQTLLSAEGDVDQEALTLAVLKATGPQRYYQLHEK